MKYCSLICVLVCLSLLGAHAQVRTIIPADTFITSSSESSYNVAKTNRDINSDIRFDLSTLPPDAHVEKVVLRLVLRSAPGNGEVHVMAKCANRPGDTVLRSKNASIYKALDPVELVSANERRFAGVINDELRNNRKVVTIRVSTQIPNAKYAFFENNLSAYPITLQDLANTPRLLVWYTTAARPASWAGNKADAQHTSAGAASFLPDTSRPTDFRTGMLNIGEANSDLMFWNDALYFFTDVNRSTVLKKVDCFTNKVTTVKEMHAAVTKPVIASDGYLYNVTEDGVFSVKLADGTYGQKIPVTRPISSPCVGRDGSLYLCDYDLFKVYTPQPKSKLLWQYKMGNALAGTIKASSPALSTDDSFAYLVTVSHNTNNFLRINILSKKVDTVVINKPGSSIEGLVSSPSVNSNNYVCLVDEYTAANELRIYDKKLSLKLSRSFRGHVSHPVISGTNFYVIVDSQKIYKIQDATIVDSINFSARGYKYFLADLDDNIYVRSEGFLIAYSFVGGAIPTARKSISRDLDRGNGIIAPDGSIYSSSTSNILTARASRFGTNKYEVTGTDVKDLHTIRAGQLYFKDGAVVPANKRSIFIGSDSVVVNKNVTIQEGAKVVLQSGAGISFKKGFRVQKKATLSCRTKY